MSDFKHGVHLTSKLSLMGETGALVGLIMGSRTDWPFFRPACSVLDMFEVPFEYGVVSAHRTEDRMIEYARLAKARGLKIIIACAGGSAHLPGMVASLSLLPVLGVAPKKSDEHAVGSMIAMPAGKPLAYMGGGSKEDSNAGAENAALFAVRILSLGDALLAKRLESYDEELRNKVPYSAHDCGEMI